jgi:uncharacterized protein (TIGR03435 family)
MRQARLAIAIGVGVLGVFAGFAVLTLHSHRQASPKWAEFSIGPPSGRSFSLNDSALRSNGITLKAVIATAFNIPAVRVFAPAWLADTRYSMTAVIGADETTSFHALLQEELTERLGLETHVEPRQFDVLVLNATEAPRLSPARGNDVIIRIGDEKADFQRATTKDLASALQSVLGQPVIDETGLRGTFDFEIEWGEHRGASVTATLRDQFGLRLTLGRRQMDALIVDAINRDASLLLLAQVGRLTRPAPPPMRRWIAEAMTTR